MRFATFEKFEKRFPTQAEWIRRNRGKDDFAASIYDHICSGEDLTPRQRKSIRSAMDRSDTPSGTPRVGDVVTNVIVQVFQAYTHEERGEERYTFRSRAGWAGRLSYDDIVKGRIKLRRKAEQNGFDTKSHEARQSGVAFDIAIERASVAWVGKEGRGFVVLEEVEANPDPPRSSAAKPPSRSPKPTGGPVPLPAPATPPRDPFGFDEPDPLPEEEEATETRTAGVTARGAPLPAFDDWREKLRG